MNGSWVGQDGYVKSGVTTDEGMARGYTWHEAPRAPAPSVPWTAPSSVQQPSPTVTYTATGHGSSGVRSAPTDWNAVGRVIRVIFLVGAACVGLIVAAPFVSYAIKVAPRVSRALGNQIFEAKPSVSPSGIYTYPASEIMKHRWPHGAGHPMHLDGRTVVVTGDVSNAFIHVNGNVTFQGTLRNVSVVDNDWTITANRVENSKLTARKIVVTGEAVDTEENLNGPPIASRNIKKGR